MPFGVVISLLTVMRVRNVLRMRVKYTVEMFVLICFVLCICKSQIHSESTTSKYPWKRDIPPKYKDVKDLKSEASKEKYSGINHRLNHKIPFIVHQLWNTRDVPKPVLQYIDTWMTQHPHWQYWFWTQKSQQRFLGEKYPRYLPLYQGYELDIQRADMIRFLILYEFGGVYADLDVEVLQVYGFFFFFFLLFESPVR